MKYCCDDKSCYDCYVALAVVAGTVSVRNLRETDKIALAAYTGAQLIEVEEVTVTECSTSESEEEIDVNSTSPPDEPGSVLHALKDIRTAWRSTYARMRQRSRMNVHELKLLMSEVYEPQYRVSITHGLGCISCRSYHESLYQEFGVFRCRENDSELGTPILWEGDLSRKTTLARTLHVYLCSPSRVSREVGFGVGELSFFLADVVLLELVDPYLVLDADHPVLRVNGFVHEINANGTIYWARGIIYRNRALRSKCIIKAASLARHLVKSARSYEYAEVVYCTKTIRRWLELMGYKEKGFSISR